MGKSHRQDHHEVRRRIAERSGPREQSALWLRLRCCRKLTSDPTDNVNATYDAENRIASASTTAGTFTYTYDAEGNRVEKSGGGSGTLYWYMTPGIVAESDLSGNLKSEYVFFNGERVARRDFPLAPSRITSLTT